MTSDATRVVDVRGRSRYELRVGDAVAGYVEYQRRGAVTSFTHTVVEPAFGGRGLGSVLVQAALDATRAEGRQVLPFCPFVRAHLERDRPDVELVPAEQRGRFGLD